MRIFVSALFAVCFFDVHGRGIKPCEDGVDGFEKPCYHCFCGNHQWICIKTCDDLEDAPEGGECRMGDVKIEGCDDCFCGFYHTWECAKLDIPECRTDDLPVALKVSKRDCKK